MIIDWSKWDRDRTPEMNCTCRCVFARLKDGDEIPTFRSHAKFVANVGMLSRKPCPDCGRNDNLRSIGSDREDG